MKGIFIVAIVLFLGSPVGFCFDDYTQQRINSNSPTSSARPSDDEGLLTRPHDEMLREVAGLSKEVGITNLKDKNLAAGQTEIRIWKGFGLISPRCFIIVLANDNATASLVAAQIVGNKGVFRNGKLVYKNTALNAPRSGWAAFLGYLREYGIDSSINLSVDKYEMPDDDSEELILEMKIGSHHSMVYYNDSTVSVDGKRAFAVCKQIRTEFDLNLGC